MDDDKRIILLCYPELESFFPVSEPGLCGAELTQKEKEEQYRRFTNELMGIPGELNEAIKLLRDDFRKENRCMLIPSLEVESVDLTDESISLYSMERKHGHIRVCLAPANCPDIKNNTVKALNTVSEDISHLVYIEIPQGEPLHKIEWGHHREGPFYAVLTSGMSWVKYVVFSIIVDILLYYVTGCPDPLEYRKTVADRKTPIIKKSYRTTLKDIYGINSMDDDVYLPLTLATIKKMVTGEPGHSLADGVRKLKKDDHEFIKKTRELFAPLRNVVYQDFMDSINNGIYLLYFEQDTWSDINQHINDVRQYNHGSSSPDDNIYMILAPGSSVQLSRIRELFKTDPFVEFCEDMGIFYFMSERLRDIFFKVMDKGLHSQVLFFKWEA